MFKVPDVLLALEDRLAEAVLMKLREMDPFGGSDWHFDLCQDAGKLLAETVPSVLVLSRNLPGLETALKKIRGRFAPARVVFLIGRTDQRARAFMERARSLGFMPNFVTGDLPGDRPYPLPVALLHDYPAIAGQPDEDLRLIGRVAVLGNLSLPGLKPVRVDRAARISRGIAAVLVQPGYRGAAEMIRSWRRKGYDGPILVCGGYDLELIAAGATGSVPDATAIEAYTRAFGDEGGSA